MAISDRLIRHLTVTSENTVAALRDELAAVPDDARVIDIETERLDTIGGYALRDHITIRLEVEVR